MKICLATYQSVLLLQGGPRTQILETQRWLRERGAEVQLFESWKDFSPDSVDLVHLFGANIGTYHLARELHKLGIPLVVTPIFYTRHANTVVRMVSGFAGAMKSVAPGFWTDYGLVREICGWARAVLPNTGREKDLMIHGMGIDSKKVSVVPNGVDERFFSADPQLFREKYGISDFVLNVGHIGPERKNVLRLIQALERINVPSVIIGRKENNAYTSACLERAKTNQRLMILDSLANDSPLLASAYAACDVFVLPSLFETPGIAALEAALAGAKIVITKYGGTEDYFGDKAAYVEPTSVEMIHHGIATALNAPKDGTLRTIVRDRFLWSHVADQYLEVYRSIISLA
jgi:glycosyltransferase involved in cell wall biosynthesis